MVPGCSEGLMHEGNGCKHGRAALVTLTDGVGKREGPTAKLGLGMVGGGGRAGCMFCAITLIAGKCIEFQCCS